MTTSPGPTGKEVDRLLNLEDRYLPRQDAAHRTIVWDHASGATVWDVQGREYIDLTSGVAVTNAGHAHPRVAEAIAGQARRLLNCYDSPHTLRGPLAKRVVDLAGPPFDVVTFQTTGAEGIEAALKIARLYTGRPEVLSFTGGYHGKTLGALSVTAIPGLRNGVGPLIPGVLESPYAYCYRCPLGLTYPTCQVACADQAWDVIREAGLERIGAVIVEPLLGLSGSIPAPPEFWVKVRKLADDHAALLIFDEVQTAFGRSGQSWFAFQRLGVVPDIVVAGKGIASGMPMTAVIGRREVFDVVPPVLLTSTYAGNPLSCAAALATIDVLEEEGAPERAGQLGGRCLDLLESWVTEVPGVGDVRGLGLNFGVELVRDAATRSPAPEHATRAHARAAELGVLLLPPTGEQANVLRVVPPLLIPEDQLWEGLDRVRRAIEQTAE